MAYSYASDKQITAELIAGDILPSSGFTSSYDAGNRLTTWQTPLASASTQQQAWNYDNAGNWNSTTINGTTENRAHSAADQLNSIAGNATTNDLKGNLTAYEINGKEYEVEYDLDNRIIKVDVDNSDVEYRYDAFGRRIIRQEGSTKSALIWWGNSECAEHKHQAGQTVIQNDIMAHPSRLNSVIARAKDGSKFKLEWYHKNYLDHVYAVSDDSGDLLEHYRYTAFGQVTIYNENGVQQATTQIDNHILWNTRRRDTVSGYYMYKFRHYSAELGRWPSRDPIEEKGGVNLYGFVGNDSLNNVDWLGHARVSVGNIIIAAAEDAGVYQRPDKVDLADRALKFIEKQISTRSAGCYDGSYRLGSPIFLPAIGAYLQVHLYGTLCIKPCCDKSTGKTNYIAEYQGGIEAFLQWGGKMQWSGDHGKKQPHKGFRDRSWHLDMNARKTTCPDEPWGLTSMSVKAFIRGTVGVGVGVQGAVNVTLWQGGFSPDSIFDRIDATGSVAWGVLGASIELGLSGNVGAYGVIEM